MTHQFTHTTSERRASTAIVGSVGRPGLFVPQDFIKYNKDQIGSALTSLEDGLDPDELEQDELEGGYPLYADEGNDSTNDNGNDNGNGNDDDPSMSSRLLTPHRPCHSNSFSNANSRRQSFLLSEEAALLKANRIPIRRLSTGLENTTSLYSSTNNSTGVAERSNAAEYNYISPNNICTDRVCDVENDEAIVESWDAAVKMGKLKTTVAIELKSISRSSIPLVITFLLQNSLSVCSILAVGHISSEALAGITLGSMTCNITAIATIAGLASSLDTFLPQAYGAKKYHLVGIIFQRCVVLIFTIMSLVCLSWWFFAERILINFLPDPKSANYATQYLKVNSFGIPGYILFETGKRFLQCQGIFDASTYVLFVCAPLNALMNYTLVWVMGLGFIGAPIAVSITYTLMAVGLYLYTTRTRNQINPMKCWTKFEISRVCRNWGELVKLSIPNLIMIVSEFLSFELMTLLSSYLGTKPLAAQSILATMASLTYQIPYGVSIGAGTRIANFLGAQLPESAFIACKSSFIFTLVIATLNCSIFLFGKGFIASIFTNDEEVIELSSRVFPWLAFMQIFDALNSTSAGCLRGQGLQRLGGYVNLFSYYIGGLPLAAFFAFSWPAAHPMGLSGLWAGSTVALIIIGCVQSYCVLNANFDQLVDDAIRRSNSY